MGLLQLLSTNELVAQALSFFLLLILLRIFVWKKFLKVLDERRMRIADEFKKIEKLQAEAADIRKDYEERIGQISETARHAIEEAVAEGDRMAEEIKNKAVQDAEKFKEESRELIQQEVANAKEVLKESVVDLVIDAAEKVIEEKLTAAGDKKLIEDFLKKADTLS